MEALVGFMCALEMFLVVVMLVALTHLLKEIKIVRCQLDENSKVINLLCHEWVKFVTGVNTVVKLSEQQRKEWNERLS